MRQQRLRSFSSAKSYQFGWRTSWRSSACCRRGCCKRHLWNRSSSGKCRSPLTTDSLKAYVLCPGKKATQLLRFSFTIICDNDLIPLPFPQKTTIWSGWIFFTGCYLGIFTSCLYCFIAFHFTISVYMLRTFHPMFHCICMYVMSGLRLSKLNKDTTYLLTCYIICRKIRQF